MMMIKGSTWRLSALPPSVRPQLREATGAAARQPGPQTRGKLGKHARRWRGKACGQTLACRLMS